MQLIIITSPFILLLSYFVAKLIEPKENKEVCCKTRQRVEETRQVCIERGLMDKDGNLL